MEQTPPITRLNKHLALILGLSRREADDLIAAGKVNINGTPATLGARITDTDTVTVNGEPVSKTTEYIYAILNKPTGYVCSRKAQGDNPTIYSLLPKKYIGLKSVGRLDKDSSGLILLTNNGDFTHRLTHPSFQKVKVYEVQLRQDLEPLHQQMISDFGVDLADGKSQLALMPLNDNSRRDWQVTMAEGRNRQIRRTFGALGYDITALHRTQFGSYSLGDIKAGEYKLTDMH